ncbi:MAG: flagellar biosynthetic protein FliO [Planctomycetota bacterium]
MATTVAIVLVCIVAAAALVRRLIGGAWRSRSARRSLQVLDILPLGGRRQLVVVRCYDRTFALGVGDKEVALVGELDSALVAVESSPAPKAVDFAAKAQEFRGLLLRAARPQGTLNVLADEPLKGVTAGVPGPEPDAAARASSDASARRPRRAADAVEGVVA